jgi:hypothetical protein
MRTTREMLTVLAVAMFAFPAFADRAPQASGMPRLAIGGHDIVAYFYCQRALCQGAPAANSTPVVRNTGRLNCVKTKQKT